MCSLLLFYLIIFTVFCSVQAPHQNYDMETDNDHKVHHEEQIDHKVNHEEQKDHNVHHEEGRDHKVHHEEGRDHKVHHEHPKAEDDDDEDEEIKGPLETPPPPPQIFNWCDLESCKCKRHIDCDNPDSQMGINCPDGSELMDISKVFQKILSKHNHYRNLLAGGGIEHLPPASRMGTLKWNPTLAKMAEKNVLLCSYERDECRNTPKYPFVGQNTGRYNYHKNMKYHQVNMILSIIDIWWNENKDCTSEQILSYSGNMDNKKKVIHHFTQMAIEKTEELGCACIKIRMGPIRNFRMVCNYCHSNIKSMHVYNPGPSASGCKAGPHKDYPNLCSEAEQYAPNPADAKMADD